MRPLALAVAVVIVAIFCSTWTAAAAPTPPVPAANPGPAVPLLYIEVLGEQVGSKYAFSPNVIIIPQVPIILNITFFNNQSASPAIQHTFTINDKSGKPVIDSGYLNPQASVSFQFTINSMTNLTFSNRTVTNRSFQPGPPPLGTDNGTIQWYCIPHVALGMVGTIILGSAVPQAALPPKGVFIRAYWIGMIAIVAMLIWIGISYYVIKGSTLRFKDNKAHVRKGLP